MIISRRAREVTLSVMLFAVPVVLLYGNIGRPSNLNFVDRILLRAVSWTQNAGVSTVSWVGDGYEKYIALWDLESRNKALRRRNAELRRNNEILSVWAKRGRELERKLGFKPAPELRMIPARVVGRGLSPFFRVLKISQHQGRAALRVGRAITVPAGLLGRVRRVYGRYADVLLLGDVENTITVIVRRNDSRGELRGTGKPGLLAGRIEYLTRRDAVRVGDIVATSGMGGRYPRDLQIGRISKVIRRVVGRYQSVEVRTFARAAGASRVYVVVPDRGKAPPPGPPRLGERRRVEPVATKGKTRLRRGRLRRRAPATPKKGMR